MAEFLYSEKILAETLGLARDDLRHARKNTLEKGPDFQELKGAIVLSSLGIAKLTRWWELLGIHWAPTPEQLQAALVDPPSAATEKEGPTPLNNHVQLRVTKIHLNPHLVEARFEDGRRVGVVVQTNKNFVVNMAITARPGRPGSAAYQLVGHCPRRRGHF